MNKCKYLWQTGISPDIDDFQSGDIYLVEMRGWMRFFLRGNTKRLGKQVSKSPYYNGLNRTARGKDWGYFALKTYDETCFVIDYGLMPISNNWITSRIRDYIKLVNAKEIGYNANYIGKFCFKLPIIGKIIRIGWFTLAKQEPVYKGVKADFTIFDEAHNVQKECGGLM